MFNFRKIPVIKIQRLVHHFPQIDSIKLGANYFGKHYSNCLLITLHDKHNWGTDGMYIMITYSPKHKFMSSMYRNHSDFVLFDSSNNKSIDDAVKRTLYGK